MSTDSRTRSLHILVLAAVFALAGELVVATLLDRAPVGVRFPRAAAIVAQARSMQPPPEVVLFGSSRLDAAVDVARLDRLLSPRSGPTRAAVLSATVMGGEGHSFEFLDDALRRAGVHACDAVVEILPETVADKVRFLDGALIRHFSWSDVIEALPDIRRGGFFGVVAETRLNPVFFYRKELLRWAATALEARPPRLATAAPPPAATEPRAAEPDPASRPERTDARRLRMELHKVRRNLEGYRIGGGAERALERTLATLQSEGTRVLLLAPPLMEAHRALYDAAVEAEFQRYVAGLERRFDLVFVDARAALPDEAMYDNHHANDEGRRRFTPLLAQALRADALARTPGPATTACPAPAPDRLAAGPAPAHRRE